MTGRAALLACWVAAACAGRGPADDAATRALEGRLQTEVDRWARVRQPSRSAVVIYLTDRGRGTTPAALDPIGRRVGRLAYESGVVLPGDTVTVEIHRVRRLGPFELGQSSTRFTYTGPPQAGADLGAAIPGLP